jgi:protein-disulfide isomerase
MVISKNMKLGLLVCAFSTSVVLTSNAAIQPTNGGVDKAQPTIGKNSSQDNGINANVNTGTSSGSETGDLPTKSIGGQNINNKGSDATPISNSNDSQGGSNDTQLEKKVIEIIAKNPQVIIQALQNFQQKQIQAQEEKVKASLMKYKNDIAKDTSAIVLGKKDAEVKLVVFLDPNCPHCRPFSLALNKARENHPNLAIFIRHWPILGKDSEDVVRGLWAIKQQGEDKFNAATKAIAMSEEKFTFAKLLAWVQDHNLNIKKFHEDADSQATKDVIEETRKLANDIGFEGTPTSLLIDKVGIRLVVPTDEKSLDSILKSAGKDASATAKA